MDCLYLQPQPGADQTPDRIDLMVMPAAGGEPRRVATPLGRKDQPSFSPDGKWLAYYGIEGEGLDYKNNSLWLTPVDGSGPAANLSESFDLHVSAWTINDSMEPELMPPTWSLDGRTIYFQVTVHGSTVLKSISTDGKLAEVISGPGVVGSFSFDRSQSLVGFFYGALDDPGQVVVRPLKSGTPRVLTALNRSWLDEVELGKTEEVWLNGPDQNKLQGWILTPPGFDPTKRYPSILEIHGGPMLQYGFYFMHEFYYLAAKGYVVYFCNPRGGRGYGASHTYANWRNWGDRDYADLMAWADHAEALPYIDPARMGVTGGSYGGYMTVWIIGHTKRFRAAVAQRCVSNLVSLWGSSDINHSFGNEINGKPPFEDLQSYWAHSPIAHIANAKTPTLVIHNENDLRCPIDQGEQVFVALKRLKVETAFMCFPEEFHGLSRTGRTDRRVARLNAILGWFEQHLK